MDAPTRISQLRYRCSHCSDIHEGLPELAFGLPSFIFEVPDTERASRCRISDDLCVMDSKHYFVRGVLELPIKDSDGSYGIGAWSTLSAENFAVYEKDYYGKRAGNIGPYVGWFSNSVPNFYSATTQKCRVHFRSGNQRPTLELEPTSHPLAIAQREGITLADALKLTEAIPGIKFLVK
jgi:hypothetical protein